MCSSMFFHSYNHAIAKSNIVITFFCTACTIINYFDTSNALTIFFYTERDQIDLNVYQRNTTPLFPHVLVLLPSNRAWGYLDSNYPKARRDYHTKKLGSQ